MIEFYFNRGIVFYPSILSSPISSITIHPPLSLDPFDPLLLSLHTKAEISFHIYSYAIGI